MKPFTLSESISIASGNDIMSIVGVASHNPWEFLDLSHESDPKHAYVELSDGTFLFNIRHLGTSGPGNRFFQGVILNDGGTRDFVQADIKVAYTKT